MGTPPFAARCLESLLGTAHEVAAVVTRADKPRGRGMEVQPSAVKELALARGIEVLTPASAKDPALAERLRAIAPDLAVVVAYGRLLPTSVLDIPRLGCINAHASLLPALRGAAPIERAILEGHASTGVTIMRINERMDAGDMLTARALAIPAGIDAGDLRARLADAAADLLVEAVELLAHGRASFTLQNEAQATYAPPLRREEALIDWSEPAARVDLRVRAFAPAPGAFTFEGARRLKILRGRPLTETSDRSPGTLAGVRDGGVAVACGEALYLVERLQPEGKRAMAAADWARGAGDVAGRRLGDHD